MNFLSLLIMGDLYFFLEVSSLLWDFDSFYLKKKNTPPDKKIRSTMYLIS